MASGIDATLPSESDEPELAVLRTALSVATRFGNLLERPAFEALGDALAPLISFERLAVVLRDGPDHVRFYVISRGPEVPFPFGTRFFTAGHPAAEHVFGRGLAYVCPDTRGGNAIDQMAATVGVLSYALIPMRSGPTDEVVAELVLGSGAAAAPSAGMMRLLASLADLLAASLPAAIDAARERRLAMIVETSGEAMLAWDGEGVITDANAAAARLSGRSREALLGASISELLHPLPHDATPAHGVRVKLMAEGPSRLIDVSLTLTEVRDDVLVARHAWIRDLSGLLQAERDAAESIARVRELEEQHRTLLDNAPLIIFRLDPLSGELLFLNRQGGDLLGVSIGEALGTREFLRGVHLTEEGLASFDNALATAKEGAASAPYEARLKRGEGGEIYALGTIYPLLSHAGRVAAIEGVLTDVSAEHVARARMVQADRLSTLGTLAAGVAHQINNPAAFILLGLDMLGRMLQVASAHMTEADASLSSNLVVDLRDSMKRIVDITRDLRLFAKPGAAEGKRSMIDVNRNVESALSLTRGLLIERADVVFNAEDVPPVVMDDGRLGQVVVNLLLRAAQAIRKSDLGGHSVTIATRSDGASVEIVVRDSGAIIPAEDLPRIWTPFLSTESSDLGTGLGLAISKEIVEDAGGEIELSSPAPGDEREGGTEVVLRLPTAGKPDTLTPPSAPLSARSPRALRVLIVDDEAILAHALAEAIGAVHRVEVTLGGAEALDRLATGMYDAVLCDLWMPGVSGERLYGEVARLNEAQAARFIFMTGVGFGPDLEAFLAQTGRPLLEKPFALTDALTAIRRVYLKGGGVPETPTIDSTR